MMKFTLALAAVSLLALPTFAGPAPKVGTGNKPKASPKAPSTGGRIGSAPVAGSKSTPVVVGTKAAPKLGIGSSSAAPKAPGTGSTKVGSICPLNSVISKLSGQEQAVMAEAEKRGVGGNECASTLKTVETAQTLAAINASGLRQLKAEGCDSVATCSIEKNGRVLDSKASALGIRNGLKQNEALGGLIKADNQACDFNGDLNNGAIHTAALTN
jgi:hypothetical protein